MKYKPAEQYKAEFQKNKVWLTVVAFFAGVWLFINDAIESLYED
jgi:hypothetical protein